MENYVRLKEIPDHFGLNRGDTVWISSDVKELIYSCMEHDDDTDMNVLIDRIQEIITPSGTLLIPTFNWDFCKGIAYDIKKTP